MLLVNEIFESISGEYSGIIPQGTVCNFIRFQGCNLKCGYCDTVKTQTTSGAVYSARSAYELHEYVKNPKLPLIITGGEPLMYQEYIPQLIKVLSNGIAAIETNGSIAIPDIFFTDSISVIIDRKVPSSGMHKKMIPMSRLLCGLKKANQKNYIHLKYVFTSYHDIGRDINWMVEDVCTILQAGFIHGGNIIVSATPENLRILYDRRDQYACVSKMFNVVYQIQLHKLLGLA